MSRECLFCEGPADSPEHIFAQWLIDRMDMHEKPFVVAHRSPDGVESREPHGLRAFTTRSVCRRCNNGWMSDLEAQFQRIAGHLVERDWTRITTPNLFAAAAEGEIIAKWALKTLICMGPAGIESDVVKSYIAHDLYKGKLPTDFHVRLGKIRDTGVGALITKGLPMWVDGKLDWQVHKEKESFKAVIGLNYLAIGLVRAPQTKLVYVMRERSRPVFVYPEPEQNERIWYVFQSAESFDKSIEAQPLDQD